MRYETLDKILESLFLEEVVPKDSTSLSCKDACSKLLFKTYGKGAITQKSTLRKINSLCKARCKALRYKELGQEREATKFERRLEVYMADAKRRMAKITSENPVDARKLYSLLKSVLSVKF